MTSTRSSLPPILAFLAALLLTLGLLSWLWIGPTVRRAPIDQQSTTVSLGTGTYYDLDAGESVESDQILSVLNTQSDQSVYEGNGAVGDDIGVYDQDGGLFDAAREPVIDASNPGFEITLSAASRIALDRVSAEPTDCCNADGDIRGLTIKWPFGVEQRDYELWDGIAGVPVTMAFVGEEEVDGLPVYRFEGEVPETDVGPVAEGSEWPHRFYETTKAYLVEPMTGRIIDSTNDVHQWIVGEDGEVLFDAADVQVAVSDATITDNVAIGNDQSSQLRLLDMVTWVAPLLGLALLVAAVFLYRPARRDDDVQDV